MEGPFGNNPAPQDFYNLDADHGTSAYDQPLNNTTSVVWSLPVGRGRRWLSNAGVLTEGLLGGWTISGINTMASGEPATLRYSPAPQRSNSWLTAVRPRTPPRHTLAAYSLAIEQGADFVIH